MSGPVYSTGSPVLVTAQNPQIPCTLIVRPKLQRRARFACNANGAAAAATDFPSFLPQSLCQEFEDPDCIQLLKSYKQCDVDVGGETIRTGYLGPCLQGQEEVDSTIPPVLLLHGFDSNVLEWRRVFGKLAANTPTYAIDLLGGGFTDMTPYCEDPDKRLSPQEIKSHLLAFCKQQIGKPVTLVGASLGGMLAIDFANENPEAVESLVLINSQGYIDGIGIGSKAPQWISRMGLAVLKSDPLRRSATKVGFYNTDKHATEDAVRAGAIHTYSDGWVEAKLAYIKSNGLSVDADKIRQVDKPTLLLWGANDEVLDPKMLSKYEADIKQTETRLFDDCGHWVHLEQADGMVEEIRNFSKRHCSAVLSS